MRPAIIVAGTAALALAALTIGARRAVAADVSPLDALYQRHAEAAGIDWRLVKAHAQAESSENPQAYNREGSSGLMQILLPLAKNRGALRHYSAGRLPEWAGVDQAGARIFDADYNVMLGASLIRENIRAYGLPKAIAVYNSDRERTAPTAGPFGNQAYVNKVLRLARALGWEEG